MDDERLVAEDNVADVAIRYLEADDHFFAAGQPRAGEWCYLADAVHLVELEAAVAAVLGDETTNGVFIRCAALMGVEWNEGQMVPLLKAQLVNGTALMNQAPDTAQADPDQLRGIRRATEAESED